MQSQLFPGKSKHNYMLKKYVPCADVAFGRTLHCTNFGIYKTFTFHVNMLKDPLSLPLLGIYFTFAFKSKGLKGDLFVIFT